MATLEEIADILNGTLQDDTEYRGGYSITDSVATFDISGFNNDGFAEELTSGLNESDDGESFTFIINEEGKELISIIKK